MSNPSFEAALAKAKQIAANLTASAPDGATAASLPTDGAGSVSGSKRSFNSNSDDEGSPATKRSFAGLPGDSALSSSSGATPASSAKLAAAAAAAAKINEKLCGSAGGAAPAAAKPPMLIPSLVSQSADAAPAAPSHTMEHKILDRYVGLMIGRGGETITRLQAESGARIQISSDSVDGTRQVTISGGQTEVDRAKRMMDAMIAEKGGGSTDRSRSSAGDQAQESIQINVPAAKVGLLIGRGGENIKSLQEKSGVKMILLQDESTAAMSEKPLKITGTQDRLNYARDLVMELLNSKEQTQGPGGGTRGSFGGSGGGGGGGFEMRRGGFGGGGHYGGGGGGGGGGSGYGESFEEIKVPRQCVGVVIGKGGEMLRKINQDTGAKVQFKQEGPSDRELPERTLQISGNVHSVQMAVERVHELIGAVMNGEFHGPDRPRGGPDSRPATYAIPAEKAGLVIGKGGETIKEIQRVSGAYVAIQREPPPNESIKVFDIQGSQAQISEAVRLICEKAGLPHEGQQGGQNYHQHQQQHHYNQQYGGDSASYYGNNGQEQQSQQQQQQQDPLPAPQYNNQTGQMDYSLAWAEYYRRQGMNEYADAILLQTGQQPSASPSQQQQQQQPQQAQQPPQQQQSDQWQQWQQWQQYQQQQPANGSQPQHQGWGQGRDQQESGSDGRSGGGGGQQQNWWEKSAASGK